ncbi:hypothetical protein WAI453_007632 [Rhynchosporium graminicola]
MATSTPTMRVTRGRTGKLPTPTSRKGFVTVFEDSESPPPSPSRKKLPKFAEEPISPQVPDELLQVVPYKKPAPFLQTFQSKKKLPDGLCIVRALGGGRYEVVPLKDVDLEVASAKENGALIESDAGLRSVLSITPEEWASAKWACDQAISSADRSIFRIRELPLELRLMIYDYALVSHKPLHHKPKGSTSPTLGLNLMLVSKAIYEETRSTFYKNNFVVFVGTKGPPDYLEAIREHLRFATFKWEHFGKSDSHTFKFLATCPKFKVLDVIVTNWCYQYSRYRFGLGVPNDPLRKFKYCPGFEKLCALRGIEEVRIVKSLAPDITDADAEALRVHLSSLLTKPIVIIPPKKVKATAVAKAKKSKKKSKNNWEDDSEYDG